MANTVPSLISAGTLPASAEAITSRAILSDTWQKVAGLQHYSHARGQLTRVSQSWPNDVCQIGSSDGSLTWPWRIPMLSTHHTQLEVWAEVTLSAGAASIRAVGTAGVASAAVAGARAWYQLTPLTLAAASSFDDVYLDTSGLGAGEVLTLHTVAMFITPLTSPLPGTVATTAASRFVPVGDTTIGADYPLSSGRLRSMSENLTDLYQRRRCVYAWAGLHDDVIAYKGSYTTQPNMQTRPYLAMPRLQWGDEIFSDSYKVQAYVEQPVGADAYLRVARVPGGQVDEYTVPAGGGGKVWVSGELDLRDAPGMGGMSRLQNTGISVYPGDAASGAPHSTTPIYSLTISGV